MKNNKTKEVKMNTKVEEVKNPNQTPVNLTVTLEHAVMLAQLAAKLPIETGLSLFSYLEQTVTPIIQRIQEERKANEDKDSQAPQGTGN